MQSVFQGRVGLVGEISGFVVAEDRSLLGRLEASLVHPREKIAAPFVRLSRATRARVAEFSATLAVLRAGMPMPEAPTSETQTSETQTSGTKAFEVLSSGATIHDAVMPDMPAEAGEAAGEAAPVRPPRRRMRRFPRLRLAFWVIIAFFVQIEDGVKRLNRKRLGTTMLALLSVIATSSALLFPDIDEAQASTASALLPFDTPDAPGAPVERWRPVRRPIAMFNLEAPEIESSDLKLQVAMRGRTARRDSMTWTPRGDHRQALRPLIHLVIERYEGRAPASRPLYGEFSARAADEGATIERMNAPDQVPSKFGPLDVAEAALVTDIGTRQCLMFRRGEPMGLALAGWYCGTGARPADRVSLSCFLDRLDLVSAGQDGEIKRYFAAAERSRRACAGARQSGRRLTWIDHESPFPALKLSAKPR
jgi:hypothetical protein